MAHVNQDGPAPTLRPLAGRCWLWTASPTTLGYGQFRRAGRAVTAHRAAWEIACRQLAPPGMRFKHTACSVRLCVNWDHVAPLVFPDTTGGARLMATWNMRHPACVDGHRFTPQNSIVVPGGRACRQCRREVEAARRKT